MRELLMTPGSGADLKDQEEEQFPQRPTFVPQHTQSLLSG